MIDAVLAVLAQAGAATVTLWTWVIAEYEVECLTALANSNNLIDATLIVDQRAVKRDLEKLQLWRDRFGPNSIKIAVTHAKIATIETTSFRFLLRGSMNLNYNPRFEQFDITEGGEDFELVRRIESELPVLPFDADHATIWAASKVSPRFVTGRGSLFEGLTAWTK